MRIPKVLKTERFYVATSEAKALSSFGDLSAAIECWKQHKETSETWEEIVGVMRVTERGQEWVWKPGQAW